MQSNVAAKEWLERLFGRTLARLDPQALVAARLAELGWAPATAVVVAAGKAARGMARGALEQARAAGIAVTGGVVITPGPGPARCDAPELSPLTVLTASHPVPDDRSVAAARTACDALAGAPAGSEALVLISGGTSALMALPTPGLSLGDKVATIQALHAAGADIHELNTVRKHLSAVKGGHLAAVCPVPITTLIISDVPGDQMDMVGSGPTLADPTTFVQALELVTRLVGLEAIPATVRAHLEAGALGQLPDTPATPRPGDRAVLVAGLGELARVAAETARQQGARVALAEEHVTGDVTEVAGLLVTQARRAAREPGLFCAIAGGEPTVTLPACPGIGGRAHQLALLVARDLAGISGVAVLVAGSDGMDGNSPSAGAVVDGQTWDRLRACGVDGHAALAQRDAFSALSAIGATVITGPTGINHADLSVILRASWNP